MMLGVGRAFTAVSCRRSVSGHPRVIANVNRCPFHVTRLRAATFRAWVSTHPKEPLTDTSGPGGGSGTTGGNNGGHGRSDGNDGHDGGGHGAWMVLILASIPYVVDGARRLSFGKDGIRILDLPAEPGMNKPIFAATTLGTPVVKAPEPPPQSASAGGGGISIVGVLAFIILCGGGYYLYTWKKRRSGPPMDDEELQMEAVSTNTRALDPSMFQMPSEEQAQAAPSASDNLVTAMDDKDSTFGKSTDLDVEYPDLPAPFAHQTPPEEPGGPPVIPEPVHTPPNELFKDASPDEPLTSEQNAPPGGSIMEDLPSKDRFFGTQTSNTTAGQEGIGSEQRNETSNPINEHQLAKDAFFGVPESDVPMEPAQLKDFTSAVVPVAPSPVVKDTSTPQSHPEKIIEVHDITSQAQLMGQDVGALADLDKDLQAKDAVFGEDHAQADSQESEPKIDAVSDKPQGVQSTSQDTDVQAKDATPDEGSAAPDSRAGKSIIDAVSEPIMNDIARELDSKGAEESLVGIGLKVDGEKVSLNVSALEGEGDAGGGDQGSGSDELLKEPSGRSSEEITPGAAKPPLSSNGNNNNQPQEKKSKRRKNRRKSKNKH